MEELGSSYPKRPVPRDGAAATELKKRTLTMLYNARLQWLADAHAKLNAAIAAAYGWDAAIPEHDILHELRILNFETDRAHWLGAEKA